MFVCLFKGKIAPLPDKLNPYLQSQQNVLEFTRTMEALHQEKALLGHCASAAAHSSSIRELLFQNKFTLEKFKTTK